jgi:predicted AAA+ superfamily ATPase
MKLSPYRRSVVDVVTSALKRHVSFMHVLVGARQTGKTTAADQIAHDWPGPVLRASADVAPPPGPEWIESQWRRAERERGRRILLILDEVQKVPGWSEVVKALWDESRNSRRIRLLILGSSALLVQKGLTESLAGRFILHRSPHWTFRECRDAFEWSLDRWIFFGGYPGAAHFLPDEAAWRQYIADSLVETAIARDVLQMTTITKPALLRHLFGFAAQTPAQILSYTKMLGSLHDAGNTTTLAHYLHLLEAAFLASGLERASRTKRRRGSSPKLVIWNNALVNALSGRTYKDARSDPAWWGRLVENAAGAHLLNHLWPPTWQVGYWREGNDEVDYVVSGAKGMTAFEIKSGNPGRIAGLDAFRKRFPRARILTIGTHGIPPEEFFSSDPAEWLK